MTDRERSLSPTPRERAVMSDREIMEFTLDRTDELTKSIHALALQMAGLPALAADHEARLRKLEHKVIWVGGAAAGVGLIVGVLLKFIGG